MPRPADTYTHDQFEQISSANLGETVRCIHCRRWKGSAKVLSRKKAHLQSCTEYKAWRAAGNGQELAPPNPYNAPGRRAFGESSNFEHSSLHIGPSFTPIMQRPRSMVDPSKYFDEFSDDSLHNKCVRVRCQSCGLVREKNTAAQAEHLSHCKEFLSTAEGTELLASGSLSLNEQQDRNPAIWNGSRPSPDLPVNPRGQNRSHRGIGPSGPGLRPFPSQTPQPTEASSLVQHLLVQAGDSLKNATRHPFLSHAGCGLLTPNAINQWLAQIGYISRSLIPFTGALIGKIRIPEIANLECDSTFRCLELLCSAVNNMTKELEFLEATKRKYGLQVNFDEPRPPTKGFVDLFNSASHTSATLLEGMVMLWATEMLFYNSFSYAGTFATQTLPTPQQNSYSLPSSFLLSGANANHYGGQSKPRNGHTAAIREAFIENWKSENFGLFVGACKSIVDELAMVQETGKDQAEMLACERVFNQAVWLWGQMFPEVTAMAEQYESNDGQNSRGSRENGATSGNGLSERHVEVTDEDGAHASADMA